MAKLLRSLINCFTLDVEHETGTPANSFAPLPLQSLPFPSAPQKYPDGPARAYRRCGLLACIGSAGCRCRRRPLRDANLSTSPAILCLAISGWADGAAW